MRARTCTCFALAALVALAMGCGSKKNLVKVEGKVTLDDQPLAGATVSFIPADGNGVPANGRTGDDGSFQLTTFNSGDGARPGDYKVVIVADPPAAAPAGGSPVDLTTPEGRAKAMAGVAKQSRKPSEKKASLVHSNYTQEAKTPLRQQVPAEGKVEIKLNKNGT
jgi:hypothetical protein